MAKRKTPKKTHYVPSRTFAVPYSQAEARRLVETMPGGVVALVVNESARYSFFHAAMAAMILPIDARVSYHTGCYVVDSCNRSVAGMNDNDDWIMFMGDDHIFDPMFLMKLLVQMYAKDLDIIVPVCFKRSFPPVPVLYKWKGPDSFFKDDANPTLMYPIHLDDYPDGGLIEVDAAGSAGMIVRRRVLEAMEPPWFTLTSWGEDIGFCRRAKMLGFKIHADLDLSLGHILNTTLWPVRSEKGGEWGCQYDFGTHGGFILGLDG